MFDAIASTYELINSLASCGQDKYWRRTMARLAQIQADDILLDVACGTGDVARTFATADIRPSRIVGVDFSLAMLEGAQSRPIDHGIFCQGDALKLPAANAGVSIVSCAFGIRNFQHLEAGLAEMYRVLRIGGRAVILEFSIPRNPLLRSPYLFYFNKLMPLAATLISRDRTGAYRYLPRSVVSFPSREGIISALKAAGFSRVTAHPLTAGIVVIYVAVKTEGKQTAKEQ